MGHLQKDQWWPLHRKSEEKLGEAAAGSSCHAAVENPWCQEWHIGQQHRGAVQKPAAAPGATPTAASLTPGTATHQSQAAFRSPDSWWLQIPAGHQPLTQAADADLSAMAVCDTLSSGLGGACLHLQLQGSSFRGSAVAGKF
uniref:Uncharacterized protein n=1 Tax=Pipistrellus kuhlii TaxID=59472 RepID=A0A7J8B2J8_PIPKU|nr:hypothetical protein mPipKuh1_007874 [Pipistrellus kuhlii]